MKTGVFMGRFQPWHEGHAACIKTILDTHDFVVILMRYGKANEANPLDTNERLNIITKWIDENSLTGRVQIIPIPDPGYDLTFFYGRKVGYEIKELKLPEAIESISATAIRAAQKETAKQDTGQPADQVKKNP